VRDPIAARLFVAFACFYLLGTGGRISTPDGVVMFRVTESLVERGTSAIPELPAWRGFGGRRGTDGRFYAWFGPGLSLAAIPGYGVGKLFAPLATPRERDLFALDRAWEYRGAGFRRQVWYETDAGHFDDAFRAFAASWTNAFVVAATLAGVFLTATALGLPRQGALLAAVLGGVASPLWPYARDFFAEPLGALGLIYFLYFAVCGADVRAPRRRWLLAGLFLGLTVFAKPAHLVLAVPAAILLAGYARALPPREAPPRLLGAALGWLGVVGLVAAYHDVRFGSPFETGRGDEALKWTTPFLEGVAGLLVSPGRGLFAYFPLALAAVFAWRRLHAARPLESWFVALSSASLLALYARWQMWEGGWCWGPRFLVPLVPLLLLPLASLLGTLRTGAARATLAGLAGLSALVALGGVAVNYADYHSWVGAYTAAHANELAARGVSNYYPLVRWDLEYAPFVRYWDFPARSDFLLPRALARPGLVLAFFAVCLAGLVWAVRGLLRASAPARGRRRRLDRDTTG
jgi:hypothetical protein